MLASHLLRLLLGFRKKKIYIYMKKGWIPNKIFSRNLNRKNHNKKYLHMPKKKKKLQNPINTEIIAQLKGSTILTALTTLGFP